MQNEEAHHCRKDFKGAPAFLVILPRAANSKTHRRITRRRAQTFQSAWRPPWISRQEIKRFRIWFVGAGVRARRSRSLLELGYPEVRTADHLREVPDYCQRQRYSLAYTLRHTPDESYAPPVGQVLRDKQGRGTRNAAVSRLSCTTGRSKGSRDYQHYATIAES